MKIKPITVNIDGYLGLNKYEVDEENAHIELVDNPDPAEFDKLVLACPAGLYKDLGNGEHGFDYAGCLECGTCRVLELGKALAKWNYPGPMMGVEYRYG
jgi:ferredoxin-like protein FixX